MAYETSSDWPASRVLIVVGGAVGLLMAVLVLAGASVNIADTTNTASMSYFAGLAGALGFITLVLSLLLLASGWLFHSNVRLHSGLAVLWGVLGLFFGLGLWLGAVLAIVGGIMGYVQATPRAPEMRRPVI